MFENVPVPLAPALRALEIPARIAALPRDPRGYPIPWFVAELAGVRDFRVMDRAKWTDAIRRRRCWICGDPLGAYLAFVIGPMCAINRVSSEPPSHRECATFAARACPFLARPHMRRRDAGLAELREAFDLRDTIGGLPIARNPGVALVWITRTYRVERLANGALIHVGEPTALEWYAEGRPATRAEILASIESGVPILRQAAETDGAEAVAALERQTAAALALVPA